MRLRSRMPRQRVSFPYQLPSVMPRNFRRPERPVPLRNRAWILEIVCRIYKRDDRRGMPHLLYLSVMKSRYRKMSHLLAEGNSSPPFVAGPSRWWAIQLLSPLIPIRFFIDSVTPAFLWVLSFGTLINTSALRIVLGIKYSFRS